MKNSQKSYQAKIINFDEINVAVLEHRAAPELLGQSIRKFIRWRQQNKCPPSTSRTFNIVYDDATTTAVENYRFDLCASINKQIGTNDYGVVNKLIPRGRCVVIRHIGSDEELSEIANYLYGQWLKQNNETLRNFPLFFERVHFSPEVSEHQMVTDVYLPIN